MVMLISRRVGIVRLDAVISENLAQAAVSARGDQLITIVGSIVDHAPAGEPLPSFAADGGRQPRVERVPCAQGHRCLDFTARRFRNGGRANGIPPVSRSVHHARCCPANRRKRIEPDHNRQPEACAAGRR
ncbi:hypothetical protein P4238_05670 [Pseudomonas aeruginosa]|nr:hypothetical protein [Pseudomonas aeruginosa]